jgi:hypothetical protein
MRRLPRLGESGSPQFAQVESFPARRAIMRASPEEGEAPRDGYGIWR